MEQEKETNRQKGYLFEFGFQIFRLTDERTEHEYILYNSEKKTYSCLNEKRLVSILILELRDKGIDLREFGTEVLKLDFKRADPIKLIIIWKRDEVILLNGKGFKPIKDLVFERNKKKYFNMFNIPESFDKDKYLLNKPMKFKELQKKAPYTTNLLLNIHGGNLKGCKDTLKKISDRIKYPDQKGQDCIIFYPAERAGKGIFYKFILQPIFEKYACKVLMKKLNNDFNAFLRESLVLVLEEGKRDLELVETLKDMVTEPTLLINEKGKNQQEEEVYFLTFVFSNNMNPIDLGKSRGSYYICRSLGKTYEESQKVGRELCDNIPNETEYLIQYLHNLEFDHQDALMPFDTEAKTQVNDLNKNALELFYDELLNYENLESSLKHYHDLRYGQDLKIPIESKNDEVYISKDLIRNCYNNFCHLEGLRSNIISHNKSLVQLWALLDIADHKPKRILLPNGRKIDHLNLLIINKHIQEKYKKEEENE